MTSRDEISKWYDRGVWSGHKYLVIVCDTYDWEDYPVYCRTIEEATVHAFDTRNMKKPMEVYKLVDNPKDKEQQLNTHRCWSLF